MQWIATIGVVGATTPPRVRYTGRVVRVSGSKAHFEDGTRAKGVYDSLPVADLAELLERSLDGQPPA